MKKIDFYLTKIKFRKLIKIYILFAVIGVLASSTLLAYAYRDKISFVYNYNQVSERMERGALDVNTAQEDLTKLAKQSSDIVDILALDNNNNITYSAKNSVFADNGNFMLELKSYGDNLYFTNSQNPDITFKLMKKNEVMLSTVFVDRDSQIQNNYRDITFFEDNTSAKKLYLLSYTTDKSTGDKIYFISDIHPVPNGPLYMKIVSAVLLLVLLLYWVFVALWVYSDARRVRINSFLWGVIALCTNIAGLFIYLIYKQNNQACSKCHALQRKGNTHCVHCGTKINTTCEKCHAITEEGDSYCSHCGNQLKH